MRITVAVLIVAVAAPLQHATFPASQRRLWLIGHVEAPASWIEFYARRPVSEIRTVAALERLRRVNPDDMVFIVPGCVDEAVCRAVGGAGYGAHSRLEPAGQIEVRDARG